MRKLTFKQKAVMILNDVVMTVLVLAVVGLFTVILLSGAILYGLKIIFDLFYYVLDTSVVINGINTLGVVLSLFFIAIVIVIYPNAYKYFEERYISELEKAEEKQKTKQERNNYS